MLPSDKEHKKDFTEVPIVGFRNGKNFKDYLVRTALPKMVKSGGSKPCGKGTCLVCDHILTLLQQKHVGKYFKFEEHALTVTQKEFFIF